MHLRPLLASLALALLACAAPSGRDKGGLVRVRDVSEADLARAQGGARHALLVGVARFDDPEWTPLRYAAKDAEDLGRALSDPLRGGFTSVTVLTRPEETTRAGVLAALKALEARRFGPRDSVVLYLSSHGTLARDARGDLQRYLVLTDTRMRHVADTGLQTAELERALEGLGSRRRLLVLATCHSGTGKSLLPPEVRAELERTKGPVPVPPLEEVSRASIVLSASDWGEAAREDDALANDVYTHFLVEALDGRADRNGDGAVSATEAHDWARRGTYAHTQGRQRPSALILEVGADPVLLAGAVRRAGAPELFSYSARLEGATLKVDGRDAGQLPGGAVVGAGKRRVEVTKGGAVVGARTVTLAPGERVDVDALLARARAARPALTLGGGVGGFLDAKSRNELVPPGPLLLLGGHLPGVLLDGRLDLWGELGAGTGSGEALLARGGRVPVRHRTLLAGVGVGPTWTFDTHAGFFGLSTGPRVAALWLQRSFRLELYREEESYVSVWPGWMGAATWRPGERWVLGLHGQLLWAYVPVDGAVRAAGFGSAGLSGGYRF